ncbi:MAG: hypothetical protein WCA20_19000 [Candidatus Sulfotelmatobacter sp.]
MTELVALRAILLNVLFKLAKGQTLTAQEMQGLIDRADSDKLRKAAGAVGAGGRAGDAAQRKVLIVFSFVSWPRIAIRYRKRAVYLFRALVNYS